MGFCILQNMMRFILVAVLSFFCLHSFAQNMFGLQAGIGIATIKSKTLIPTPSFAFVFSQKASRGFNMGVALSYQRYSFNPQFSDLTVQHSSDILSISQSSGYLAIAPKADICLSTDPDIHLGLSSGVGVLLGGDQITDFNNSLYTRSHIVQDTRDNISRFIFTVKIELSEYVFEDKNFAISLFQEFCIVPSYLSTNQAQARVPDNNNFYIRTSYFSLSVMLSHKYGKAHKKQAKTKTPQEPVKKPFHRSPYIED